MTTLLLFALLAFLTALSVLWSIVPELSYVEAGRTFAYLAVFAARWPAPGSRRGRRPVLLGLLIGAIVPVAYALASRVWPGALAENELSNRLGQPFDYWNAVGCVAAMAVPVALWLGSRRTGPADRTRARLPGDGRCASSRSCSRSRAAPPRRPRSARSLWFALVPLRLRSLPVLVLPLGAASAVAAWALSKDPFSKSLQPLSAKEAVAGEFGVLVLLLVVLLCWWAPRWRSWSSAAAPSARLRRRVGSRGGGRGVPRAARGVHLGGLQRARDRRPHRRAHQRDGGRPQEGGGRVFAASSSRGKYWREAFSVFEDRPVEGVGAGAFAKARLRHRNDASVTRHAHGWVPQTMADLGLLGAGAHDAAPARLGGRGAERHRAAAAPAHARRRGDAAAAPARLGRRAHRARHARAGAARVRGAVAARLDLVHPGPTAMALIGGRLRGRPRAARRRRAGRRRAERPLPPDRCRIAGAVVAIGTALLLAWAIWQPEASDRATNEALALTDEREFDAAIAKTEDAEELNPLTPDPLLVRASVDTAADRVRDAQREPRARRDPVPRRPADLVSPRRLPARHARRARAGARDARAARST